MSVHACARTTPALRRGIQKSLLSERLMAKQYNVSLPTIRKWKQRDNVDDRRNRPHRFQTSLTEAPEHTVVVARATLMLSLDDLLVITRRFLYENASRAASGSDGAPHETLYRRGTLG